MPISWKIVLKKFFFYLTFIALFLVSTIIFFKIAKFIQFYTEGITLKEIFVLLSYFLLKSVPFILSIAAFIACLLVCYDLHKTKQIYAYAALGKHPFSLFFPLLYSGCLLSCFNVAIYCKAIPMMERQIDLLAKNKYKSWNLSLSLGEKLHNDNIYLQIKKSGEKKRILFIDRFKGLFWLTGQLDKENDSFLYLKDVSSFQIVPEKTLFNSVVCSTSKEVIIPKEALFAKVSNSIIKSRPNLSAKIYTKHMLLSFFPLLFAFFAIALSTRIRILVICSFLFCTSIFLLASTASPSFIVELLSISLCLGAFACSFRLSHLSRGFL